MGSYFSYMHRRNPPDAEFELIPEEDAVRGPIEGPYLKPVGKEPRFADNFLRSTLLSAGGFAALNLALPVLLPRMLPGFSDFSIATQRDFVLYVSSCLHHCVTAPWSLRIILNEWHEAATLPASSKVNFHRSWDRLVPFVSGYFLSDFLFMLLKIPQTGLHAECECAASSICVVRSAALLSGTVTSFATISSTGTDFLHHVAALVLIGTGIDRKLSRFVPQFMVCEISTVLLDIMWFMRQVKLRHYAHTTFMLSSCSLLAQPIRCGDA
jgi:hypothetical protein